MGIAALLIPAAAITYLYLFADPAKDFHSAAVHEIAISFATLTMAFLGYLSLQVHGQTDTPFFRFVTLGILGFAAVYLPHGVLTRAAHHNAILFLVFGPFSRLTFSGYLLIALLHSGWPRRKNSAPRWWPHIILIGFINVALIFLATYSFGLAPVHLRITESVTLGVFGVCVLLTAFIRTPLSRCYPAALLLFAQASIGFLLAKPWNHVWWLAHLIFAAGAFVLGYGIARAYEGVCSIKQLPGK